MFIIISIQSLDELTELMNDFKRKEQFYPIPNPRIGGSVCYLDYTHVVLK